LRGWGDREGAEWVVREGVAAGGEMTQALYAHMNNKIIKKRKSGIIQP
jgi:NaMN:DMB phosphoribosyltransferase